ncbi:transcription termination factor 4, mitochondrial [Sceloporus undulatus]|uniref:transcription termination factor 4, mitochondrial n=1 Tax=Sceloporus undulatus TaxID=8520 RepID=UPI001C4BF3E9|nr:transcription termination factor 4, mitochondrial [Sceloporus undulatus]
MALGRGELGQILKKSCLPAVCHYVQSSLKAAHVEFLCSFQSLGFYRLTRANSTEQSEASFPLHSSKADSSKGSEKPLKTPTISPVDHERSADLDCSKLGKVADSFLDMGLSPAQVTHLFSLQPKLPPQPRLTVVSELLLLGLSTEATLSALQKNPELLRMPAKHLRDRANLLRRLGFQEGGLNHVALCFPSIFSLPQKRIEALERLLREKCLFTVDQVSTILQTCPNMLLEELNDVEYKFQFAYFRMGVKHREIVKSSFFQAKLTEIRNRFIFLERLGLYQTPDKKGQTQIVNPKLKNIIRASENDFVTKIAYSTIEEYEIFKKLLAREEEQKWEDEEAVKNERSDLENEDEGFDMNQDMK